MSEVNRIDTESLLELIFILYPENNGKPNYQPESILSDIWLSCANSPECCAVKMDHHPLRRVKNKRVGEFNALQGPTELRTEVSRASIRSINMEPESFLLTCEKVSILVLTFYL